MTWYLTPSARAIIEAIRAEPPSRVVKRQRFYTTTDEWQVFEGPLVDALAAVGREAFELVDASGDEDAIWAFINAGNVQDVIAAVLNCPLPGTHFTCDREKLDGIRAALAVVETPMMEEVA